ncbi:type I restriction enzyme [Streptococcus pneumoniae]|nr:type I restriction enzyme [Streptococcus pneumoniae]
MNWVVIKIKDIFSMNTGLSYKKGDLSINNKSTGTSYPAINDYNFNLLLIALPPLSEQQRIVEAIESAL